MAFNVVPTVSSGDSWTASQHNTYIKDNFAAVWVGTTNGDMDYYTGASGKTRLGIGAAGAILRSDGTVPVWLAAGAANTFLKSDGTVSAYGALVYRRQGGNASNWAVTGTTSYTPAATKMQVGTRAVTVTSGTGSANITYPEAYTQRAVIFLSADASSGAISLRSTGATVNGFTIEAFDAGAGNITVDVYWMAIGA